MSDGGTRALQSDDGVTGNGEVRRLEERVRALERHPGRKTLEVEILQEALAKSQSRKQTLLSSSLLKDPFR